MDRSSKHDRPAAPGSPRTRRTFLLTGGAMLTGYPLFQVHPLKASRVEQTSQRRIHEIVNRYGSELGKARFV